MLELILVLVMSPAPTVAGEGGGFAAQVGGSGIDCGNGAITTPAIKVTIAQGGSGAGCGDG